MPHNHQDHGNWNSHGRERVATLDEARALFPHRFTLEHVPGWYLRSPRAPNGRYYAPQFASDEEWYKSTMFPPFFTEDRLNAAIARDCRSYGYTYPLGVWLDAPYQQENRNGDAR